MQTLTRYEYVNNAESDHALHLRDNLVEGPDHLEARREYRELT